MEKKYYYIGGVAGVLVLFVLYRRAKKNGATASNADAYLTVPSGVSFSPVSSGSGAGTQTNDSIPFPPIAGNGNAPGTADILSLLTKIFQAPTTVAAKQTYTDERAVSAVIEGLKATPGSTLAQIQQKANDVYNVDPDQWSRVQTAVETRYTDTYLAQVLTEARQQTPGATDAQIQAKAQAVYGVSPEQFARANALTNTTT